MAEWRWPPTFLISSFIVSNFVPLVCPIPIFSLSLYILRRRRPAALFLSSYLSVSTYFFPSIYMYFVLLIYLSLSTSFCKSISLRVLRFIGLSVFVYFVLLIYLSLSTSFYWSICLCVLCYIDLSISLYVLCSIELSTSVYFFPLIFTSFFPIHYVLFLYKCTSVFCPFSLCSYLVSV